MPEFSNPAAFAAHLLQAAAAMEHGEATALEKAAVLVEKRAKDKIGEYQDAVGPFAKWAELADSTKIDRVRKGFPENEPLLRTGAMRDSIEHTVADHEAHIGSNNDIALYQELGTSRIPPRSFLGGAMAELEKHLVDTVSADVLKPLTR